jgi:hypothetical protein
VAGSVKGLKMKHLRDVKQGALAATSDHKQGEGSFLWRVSVFGAAEAVSVTLFGLLGYVPCPGALGSIREGRP